MELNITAFFRNAAPADYSASCMELGDNAGAITWQAACDDAADFALLDTNEKREAFKAHIRGFGAWSEEEIAAWSDIELNALCMQFVAGDMREAALDSDSTAEDWERYESDSQAGQVSGRIARGSDGCVLYYLGD